MVHVQRFVGVAQVGVEVISIDEDRAHELGARILGGFSEALGAVSAVRSIRGMGMMIAIELDRPCAELVTRCLQKRLLINVTAERVIRLLPPLVMQDYEADLLVQRLSAAIKELTA